MKTVTIDFQVGDNVTDGALHAALCLSIYEGQLFNEPISWEIGDITISEPNKPEDKIIHNVYGISHSLTVNGIEGMPVNYSRICQNGEYFAAHPNIDSKQEREVFKKIHVEFERN